MNEFSFIKFSETIPSECEVAIPVLYLNNLAFFAPDTITSINYVTSDGTFYENADITIVSDFFVKINDIQIGFQTETDKCFRLELNCEGDIYYSNLLRYVPSTLNYSLLKYWCDNAEMGFDYSIENSYNQLRLPITLVDPQFPEESTIYKDRNGVRRVLSASVDFQYTLETDYMPVEWHKNMAIALAHDYVYIDGVQYQKDGAYEVDYENEYETDCGQKLYRATAKMLANLTQRNSNC